jgi:hypothetical protein
MAMPATVDVSEANELASWMSMLAAAGVQPGIEPANATAVATLIASRKRALSARAALSIAVVDERTAWLSIAKT